MYTLSKRLISVVDLDHLTAIVLVRCLYCKVTLLKPISYCSLCGSHNEQLILTVWGVYSSSLRADYLHKCFEILLRICVSSPFTIFSSLFMVWTWRHLIYTLGYNPVLYYSFSQIVGHWALFHWLSMPVPLWHIAIIVFLFFTVFLEHWQDTLGSSSIYPTPGTDVAISPWSFIPFIWEMTRKQDQGGRCTCHQDFCLSRPSSLSERGNMHAYTNHGMNAYL